VSWHRYRGGPGWAAALGAAGLATWTFVPLMLARLAISRRDL
jgi:hypothetical protein